jgi:D-inositol-3-phosphate glycosyltransferase
LVAAESAACGTPVLGFDTTGLRSSIAEGVTGLLLRSREPAVWADEIRRVLADESLLAHLRAGGVASGQRSTWSITAYSLARLYYHLSCRLVAA